MKKLNRSKLVNILPVLIAAMSGSIGIRLGIHLTPGTGLIYWGLLYLISFCAVEFLTFYRGEDLIVPGYKNVDSTQKTKYRIGAVAVDFLFMALWAGIFIYMFILKQ